MIILLWEYSDCFSELVLWDGLNTYWNEEMKPSAGYEYINILNGKIGKEIKSRFTIIGVL